jgi:hypothetical protein
VREKKIKHEKSGNHDDLGDPGLITSLQIVGNLYKIRNTFFSKTFLLSKQGFKKFILKSIITIKGYFQYKSLDLYWPLIGLTF